MRIYFCFDNLKTNPQNLVTGFSQLPDFRSIEIPFGGLSLILRTSAGTGLMDNGAEAIS